MQVEISRIKFKLSVNNKKKTNCASLFYIYIYDSCHASSCCNFGDSNLNRG